MTARPRSRNPRPHPTAAGARRFRRRILLRALVGGGAALALSPLPVRQALSSSGELRMLFWSDYLPTALTAGFEQETGIRIKHFKYGSNEELLSKLKTTKGRGYDLVGPTVLRAPQWKPLGLLQPFDQRRVPHRRIEALMMALSDGQWFWDGGLHHLPYVWGTEALAWRADKWSPSATDLSYADLWGPEMEGLVMGRPHSMMLAIGLHLDATGKVPSNRMLDAYKDEDNMRRIWGEITAFAVEHRKWVHLFWNDAETQKNGFLKNDIVLGQTWDGPAAALRRAGEPVRYMAPKEGALAWLDGLAMPKGAVNLEQVYAFLDYIYRPEIGAMIANETGYNTVAVGAEAHLTPLTKQIFRDAYPGNTLQNLWWWPPEPIWYARLRDGFRDQFLAG